MKDYNLAFGKAEDWSKVHDDINKRLVSKEEVIQQQESNLRDLRDEVATVRTLLEKQSSPLPLPPPSHSDLSGLSDHERASSKATKMKSTKKIPDPPKFSDGKDIPFVHWMAQMTG